MPVEWVIDLVHYGRGLVNAVYVGRWRKEGIEFLEKKERALAQPGWPEWRIALATAVAPAEMAPADFAQVGHPDAGETLRSDSTLREN
jgi:hypothetical protein